MTSCEAYERDWTVNSGQQFLTDLKRLENSNVVHKHLAVQGDHTSLPTNVYVIAQALTSILTNPQNLRRHLQWTAMEAHGLWGNS